MISKHLNLWISWRKILGIGLFLSLIFSFSMPLSVGATGEAGWALAFDGENDYVKLGRTDTILGSNWKETKSISMWVKPEGEASICLVNDVASCEQIFTDQPHFFGIARGIIEGQDRIWVWNFDGSYKRVPIAYTAGEWVHVSYVMSGGLLKAYRNGNFVGQVSTGDTFMDETVAFTTLLLGAFIRSDRVAAFEGQIDEVRLYNTELLPETISSTLRTPLVGDESGLRAYYQMSDGSGITLTDDSINNFNGTLMDGFDNPGNGPLWVTSSAWDHPVADDQLVTTPEDTEVAITLTGSSAQGGSLVFHLVDGPSNGTLTGVIPNYTYHPDPNFSGQDSFTFYVSEDSLQSGIATIEIEVSPVNDAPVAVGESYTLAMNEQLDINPPGLLANDSDVDGDDLVVGIVTYTGSGTLYVIEDGAFTYIPSSGFFGEDQFRYSVSDQTALSNEVTVYLTITQTEFYLFLPSIIN